MNLKLPLIHSFPLGNETPSQTFVETPLNEPESGFNMGDNVLYCHPEEGWIKGTICQYHCPSNHTTICQYHCPSNYTT